jgi:hypothetical protein
VTAFAVAPDYINSPDAGQTYTIQQATPTITWTPPAAISYGTLLDAAQLNAMASVAGTYAYTPTFGALLSAGIHTLSVTFTPADNTAYWQATTSVQLTVEQITPTLTWAAPPPIKYGTALGGAQLSARASIPGAFVYFPSSGTVLNGGSHALSVTFTPTDQVDYTAASTSVQILVTQATPAVGWAAPAPIVYGTKLGSAQLNASAPVAGTFVYTPSAGSVLNAGTHTLSAIFAPTNQDNYSTVSISIEIAVKKAELNITANDVTAEYGRPLPKLSYSISGFVNHDKASVLSGAPVEMTQATRVSAPGIYPIEISKGTLDAENYGFDFKDGELTIKPIGIAAAPVFNPAPGMFKSTQSVKISDSTPGAIVYYTLNGETPSSDSKEYTKAIKVDSARVTLKAIAFARGYSKSRVATGTYVVK